MTERKRQLIKVKMTIAMIVLVMIGIAIFAFVERKNKSNLDALGEKGYPESLIELAKRYPETIDFVQDYEKRMKNPLDKDISKEVEKGTIPLFLQWDERWGYESYGNNFLAITACGPTCISMVYSGLTGKSDKNPYEIAKIAEKEGFYVEGSGSSWSIMEEIPKELGLKVHSVSFDADGIKSELKKGRPIICIVGPGDFTRSGHFIVLVGVDDDGKIIVNDPNSKINSEKSWDVETIMKQTRNLWSYSLKNKK